MITAQELDRWASNLLPCLMDANITLRNIIILDHENSNELRQREPELVSLLRYQQQFILVVQLDKFYSKNAYTQKRNINELCNRFEKEPIDNEIKEKLFENSSKLTDVFRTEEDLKDAVEKVRRELLKYDSLIEKIKFLRNKVYAHTDPNAEFIEIDLAEFRNLLPLTNEIYNTLFGKIFDRHYQFDFPSKWDFENLQRLLIP